MIRSAFAMFRKMGNRSKKIFGGLVRVGLRVGVREVTEGLPVVGTVSRLVEELADFGAAHLADSRAEVPGLKSLGDSWSPEELDSLDQWLTDIMASLHDLHQRLDDILDVQDDDPWSKVADAVEEAVEQRRELADELAKVHKRLRKQTLSLHRVERQLSDHFHVQKGIRLSLEEIKAMLVDGPSATEWAEFRRADPVAVKLLVQADELILEGRRDEGEKCLLALLRQRGVGTTVIARHLGLCKLEEGRLDQLTDLLDEVGAENLLPVSLSGTVALATTLRSRPSGPSWPTLPRGFVVGRKYRIEEEVGRGGMASVYRVVGVDRIQQGKVFALKVPAPGVVDDGTATADRFVREIQLAMQMTDAVRRTQPQPAIVPMLDYVVFDEPAARRELYGLVMEFIEGKSLARVLAERRAEQRPLSVLEIRGILAAVGGALEFAHGQRPPLLHRDVKSANVMVTPDGHALLMDFGIGRLLDEQPGNLTRVGNVMGTPGLMPPELFDRKATLDERVDVYMAGKLLQEMMTFEPTGDPEQRGDCPPVWVDLIANATNQVRGKRPRSMRAYLDCLLETSKSVAAPAAAVAVAVALAPPLQKAQPTTRKPPVVDNRGLGDFRTINEAIDATRPGSCILIRPGRYTGGIRLNNSVDLIGDGPAGSIVVENDNGPALEMGTNHATVRGLTLRCTAGTAHKRFFGVEVSQGRLLLESCDITSDSLAGIGVHGVHADPLVRHCTILNGQGTGIFVFDHGHGTFEGCTIANNAKGGVSIAKGANPVLIGCDIHDNRGAGILAHNQGRGIFDGCEVFAQHHCGIAVLGGSVVQVQKCTIRDNATCGIIVGEHGRGTFFDCAVAGNGHAGVEARTGGEPVMQQCRICGNGQVGVYVHNQGTGTFEDCDVGGNKREAWAIEPGCTVVKRNNG
jgi:F-box protein 11